MNRLLQSNTLKMAISSTIAIYICSYLGLKFAVTSGIIAILSIQNTKKEALIIGIKRLVAATIAIILSFILYLSLGSHPLVFGLFLLIFINISKLLKIEVGIAVGAVLSTHLLTSSNINVYWIINEFFLTLIGIVIALIFNFITRSLEEDFQNNRRFIEEKYRLILLDMSESLLSKAVPIYQQRVLKSLGKVINETSEISKRIYNNNIFRKYDYYSKYTDMRIIQFDIIRRMNKHFARFYMTMEQTNMLAEFTKNVAINISQENDCIELLEQLEALRKSYKEMELPKTREEFENRALLFQFLNDLEEILLVKKEFVLSIIK